MNFFGILREILSVTKVATNWHCLKMPSLERYRNVKEICMDRLGSTRCDKMWIPSFKIRIILNHIWISSDAYISRCMISIFDFCFPFKSLQHCLYWQIRYQGISKFKRKVLNVLKNWSYWIVLLDINYRTMYYQIKSDIQGKTK